MDMCGISDEQMNSLLLTWLLDHKLRRWGDAAIRGDDKAPKEVPECKDQLLFLFFVLLFQGNFESSGTFQNP